MKKILIPLFGTLLLSFALPSLATFYSPNDSHASDFNSDFNAAEHLLNGSSAKSGPNSYSKNHKNKKSRKNSSKKIGSPSLNHSIKFDERANASNTYADSPRKPRSWQGVRPADDSKKYTPPQWSKPDFKQYDHKFWSRDDFKKAMHCWLAPHLHEDKEFVNRHWKNRGYKWKSLHKHYKHKWQKPKPDKPSEVPLPAATWLFVSALLGLAAIGRQRPKPI